MNPKRRARLILIVAIVSSVSVATALVLYSLKQNINAYYTPTQLSEVHLKPHQLFHLGGVVKKGSLHYSAHDTLSVRFVLTDFKKEKEVIYHGILPALFREGQGVIIFGYMKGSAVYATQVLAKHDEKYRPPQLH